jgi:phospholipid-translocating ATPase
MTKVTIPEMLVRDKWSEIEVGDLVLVEKNERVPADLLLLTCSDPKGVAHIETSTLDGEKHLKPRESIEKIRKMLKISQTKQEGRSD